MLEFREGDKVQFRKKYSTEFGLSQNYVYRVSEIVPGSRYMKIRSKMGIGYDVRPIWVKHVRMDAFEKDLRNYLVEELGV